MGAIDFIIIGAAKSATTWLQKSLQSDDKILMPDPELHYFSREYHRGTDWYLSHFESAGPGRIVGEKSNSYLDSLEAPSRIRANLPNVRMIAQLRNPIERAYSDYCMLCRRGEVSGEIDAYLDPRQATNRRFLDGGLYFRLLNAYLDLFPASQLLILFHEDVEKAPNVQLDLVRTFLGLGGADKTRPVAEKVKDRSLPVIGPGLRRVLRPLKPVVAPIRGTRVFTALRNVLARETAYPALSAQLRDRMIDFYAQDAESLGSLIGRDLSHWLRKLPNSH